MLPQTGALPRSRSHSRASLTTRSDELALDRVLVRVTEIEEDEDGLLTLWWMTRELAKADMSLARCWEGSSPARSRDTAIASMMGSLAARRF